MILNVIYTRAEFGPVSNDGDSRDVSSLKTDELIQEFVFTLANPSGF